MAGRFKIGMGILAASLLLTGCAKEEPKQTEITLLHGWGTMEEDHVIMRRIYEDFEKKNPDIHINLLSMPSSQEAIYKANDMLAVGEIPDIIFTGGIGRDTMYRFMVDKGYAVDFTPYLEQDQEFAEDVAPQIRRYWETEEGKLYTISDVLLYSGGYWYNEDIFRAAGIEEIPADWEAFMEACEKITEWAQEKEQEVTPIQLNGENSLYLTDILLLDAGDRSWQAVTGHRMEIIQPEFSVVLDKLKAVHEYSGRTPGDYGYRDVMRLFNEGKAAMYLNGVWAGSMINEDIPARYAPLPTVKGATASCISACLGYVVGDTGDEEKTKASVRFVKYMVSDEIQRRILEETGQVPSNPNVKLEKESLSHYPEEDFMSRYLQAAEAVREADIILEVPDNIWDSARSAIYKSRIMEVLRGELQKQTFMDLLR